VIRTFADKHTQEIYITGYHPVGKEKAGVRWCGVAFGGSKRWVFL